MRSFVIAALFFVCVLPLNGQESSPRLVDEFGRNPCGDMTGRLDVLIGEWLKNSDERIVVIYYSERYRKNIRYGKSGEPAATVLEYPHPDDGLNWAKGILRYLVDRLTYGNPPDSENYSKAEKLKAGIALISGGYREDTRAELWLVPPSVSDPIPTPVLRESDVRFGAKKPYPIPAYFFCYSEH